VKVCDQLCPCESVGEFNCCGPLLVVTVCGALSSLVHVIVSPEFTVTAAGEKAKFAIRTL
jgi:hypothetical protein